MKKKLKYDPDLDLLNNNEKELLKKACDAIENFVSRSEKINKIGYKTRDAHVTPYSSLRGTFSAYNNFEEHAIFPVKNLDCIIRISNAHMKLVSQKKTVPAYGFSVKISDAEDTVLNLPLVNFPLFPIDRVSSFLKIFTSINYFFSGNIAQKFLEFSRILKNLITVIPDFFHPSFITQVFKFINKRNDFILSFDYHSIGAYRLGDHMVKYKLVPIGIPRKTTENRIDLSIKNYLENNDHVLELMIQYCYDLKDQPINQLNKMWKNSEFIPIGKIKISELIDKDDKNIEKMSFDPFENIAGLEPVGKIQKLRDEAYKTSLKTRNK